MNVLKTQIISRENISQYYKEHGFVLLKNILDLDQIKAIKKDLTNYFKKFVKNSVDFDSAVINLNKNNKELLYKLHTESEKHISFNALLPTLQNIINDIEKNDKPIHTITPGTYFLSIPRDKRLVYNFHQESNYMKDFNNIYNIHYPLFRKSTKNNGTMSILAGSHRLGTMNFEKQRSSKNSYTDLIPENIDLIKKKFKELHVELEVGDCFIFNKDLIHKSNYNNSDLCRPVGIFRLTTSPKEDFVPQMPDEL
tara:strand:- start:75 stop:833 length:759 start_codon:yes stop_codon:yes gene_type:complete